MCRFKYVEYQACGCQLYHGNEDIEFCDSKYKDHWITVVLIPRTDKDVVTDYCHEFIRYMTAPEERTKQFKWITCPKKEYKCEKFIQPQDGKCPWHDRTMIQLKHMEGRKDADGDKKRQKEIKRAHQKGLDKLEQVQLARQSEDCVVQ